MHKNKNLLSQCFLHDKCVLNLHAVSDRLYSHIASRHIVLWSHEYRSKSMQVKQTGAVGFLCNDREFVLGINKFRLSVVSDGICSSKVDKIQVEHYNSRVTI